MKKRIIKNSCFYGIICSLLIILVESIIQLKFSVLFSVSFFLGLIVGIGVFILNDYAICKLLNNEVSKPKVSFSFLHIIKILIYGLCMYFVAQIIGVYQLFTCAFGMLFHKIIIYYSELIKEKIKDKKRKVDDLGINNNIKEKLKNNGFIKVIDITCVSREDLHKFLTKKEAQEVIDDLKKYELFIKGELEAMLEDDETVDI